jgi:hypothetical protein
MKHEHNAMPQQLTLNNKNSTKCHYRLIGGVTYFFSKREPQTQRGAAIKGANGGSKSPFVGRKSLER